MHRLRQRREAGAIRVVDGATVGDDLSRLFELGIEEGGDDLARAVEAAMSRQVYLST
jgi:hypothetical protein